MIREISPPIPKHGDFALPVFVVDGKCAETADDNLVRIVLENCRELLRIKWREAK